MPTAIRDIKLKALIKESVREALGAELMRLKALFLPEVSKKEQEDIDKRYGRPSRKRAKSHNLEI